MKATLELKPGSKAVETRKKILDAALALFQENGFENTTMRAIASRAGVALGAAYYYFDSKEKFVLAFYSQTQDEMESLSKKPLSELRDFKERLRAVLDLKFKQLKPYRKFMGVLFRNAADPESPISPFGPEAKEIREKSIALFKRVVDGSDLRLPSDLSSQLPSLLWLYQMGLILFWIHDRSARQQRTQNLIERSLNLIMLLLRISKLPLMGPLRRSALELAGI